MTCDSCGDEEDLVEVTRLYVTLDEFDREQSVRRATSTERWCIVCRHHYPHEPIHGS